MRSKCRTVDANKASLDQLPSWNYDGSSTEQAPGEDSEVIIKPRAVFKDPFRPGDNIIVLTDTYTPGGTPLPMCSEEGCPTLIGSACLAINSSTSRWTGESMASTDGWAEEEVRGSRWSRGRALKTRRPFALVLRPFNGG